MLNAKVIRTIIGIIGNVLSTLISLSQMPTFIQMHKKESVEDYIPYHHVGLMMKRSLWVLYGLPFVSKDNILVATSNGVGLAIEVIYLVVYFTYCGNQSRRRNTGILLINGICFVGFFYVAGLPDCKSSSPRHTFIGIVCNIVTPMIDVIIALCSEYVPVWLSLAGFINAGIWIAYSSISKVDIYVLISNCLGLLLCATEFSCYNAYNSCVHSSDSTTPTEKVVAV